MADASSFVPLVGPVVGALLGASAAFVFAQANQWLVSGREERKARHRALAELLALRYALVNVLATRRDLKFEHPKADEATAEMSAVIDRMIGREEVVKRLEALAPTLAEIDPTLPLNLRVLEKTLQLAGWAGGTKSTVSEFEPAWRKFVSAQETRALAAIDAVIEEVAKECNRKTRHSVAHALAARAEADADTQELLGAMNDVQRRAAIGAEEPAMLPARSAGPLEVEKQNQPLAVPAK